MISVRNVLVVMVLDFNSRLDIETIFDASAKLKAGYWPSVIHSCLVRISKVLDPLPKILIYRFLPQRFRVFGLSVHF